MKKKFLYIMMALCSFSFVACSDDDYILGKKAKLMLIENL